jgi:S-adenosylmethionine:tRNA ribosyltransferase-isomerase
MSTPEKHFVASSLDLKDFEYELPAQLIAQEPSSVRHESKLLYLNKATSVVSHHTFGDLADLLEPSDLVVINDTRVIPAKFIARRASGGTVKLLLLRPEVNPQSNGNSIWQAMVTPIRRLRVGEILSIHGPRKNFKVLITNIITAEDGHKRLLVNLGTQTDVFELLNDAGQAPLPPYITRADPQTDIDENSQSKRENDLERYQTIFASAPGAVAAPTAGLHFSDQLVEKLAAKGVNICRLTLHVGPGTFKPISESIENHHIEAEEYSIPEHTAQLINSAKSQGRRIIAVGTTSCRALESAAANGVLQAKEKESTTLYIRPGFSFQIVDGLITNFHLSRSSLLLLVSAFAGHKALIDAYKIAIDNNYRFFSYGDSMLIL